MKLGPFNLGKQDFTQKDDNELMTLVAQGSTPAFQTLFERYGGKVLGFSKKLLGDLQRSEEASQDIWLKVVRLAESYEPSNFNSWLMTMTRNHCLNILRKDKKLSFHENLEELGPQEALTSESLETELLQKDNFQRISLALEKLPDKQRVALTLLVSEGLSYEELASELDMSLGALKSVIHRARKALKLEMSEGGF